MGRRILGAFVIVASVLLYRPCGDDLDGGSDRAASPETLSVAVGPSPRSPSSAPRSRQSVPIAFRQDPLKFLSTAPTDSLQLLPGIGPVLAERLASARTGRRLFTRWEDVLDVEGIGPKKLQKLKDLADP